LPPRYRIIPVPLEYPIAVEAQLVPNKQEQEHIIQTSAYLSPTLL